MDDMIYKFCPRCGAVTRNMICDNCGYDLNAYTDENDSYNINDESLSYEIEAAESIDTKPQKKRGNHWWIWALIIAISVLAVLSIVVFILIAAVLFAMYSKASVNAYNSQVTTPNYGSPFSSGVNPDYQSDLDDSLTNNDLDAYQYDFEYIVSSGFNVYDYDYEEMKNYLDEANECTDEISDENSDYFYGDYYITSTGKEHVKMTKDDFTDPYFAVLADYYDDSYDYDIERRYVRVEGKLEGVFCNLYGAYYVIDSDDVDFSSVNEELKKRTYANLYRIISEHATDYVGGSVTVYADSYITFNNDEIMSIVYDDYSYLGNLSDSIFWSGVNIDMKNAIIMDNNDLVEIDDDFIDYFIERSNIQNSYVYAINANPVDKIREVFEDPEGLILFFTPVGMEIGINYSYGGTYGWVTITVNDFDEYISDGYSFDTSFSSDFDAEAYEIENQIISNGVEVYGSDDEYSFPAI